MAAESETIEKRRKSTRAASWGWGVRKQPVLDLRQDSCGKPPLPPPGNTPLTSTCLTSVGVGLQWRAQVDLESRTDQQLGGVAHGWRERSIA